MAAADISLKIIYIFLLAVSTPATFTKFAGCLHWGVSISETEISLIRKNMMGAADISLKIIYIFLLAVSTPATFTKFAGCLHWGVDFSETGRFDLGPLLQGQTRIAKLKSAYNLFSIGPGGLGW